MAGCCTFELSIIDAQEQEITISCQNAVVDGTFCPLHQPKPVPLSPEQQTAFLQLLQQRLEQSLTTAGQKHKNTSAEAKPSLDLRGIVFPPDFNFASFLRLLQRRLGTDQAGAAPLSLDCSGAHFSGPIMLADMQCRLPLNWSCAIFEGVFLAQNSSFAEEVCFAGAVFGAQVDFTAAHFSGDLNCSGASFHELNCYLTRCAAGANFQGINTSGKVNLQKACIAEALDLSDAICALLDTRSITAPRLTFDAMVCTHGWQVGAHLDRTMVVSRVVCAVLQLNETSKIEFFDSHLLRIESGHPSPGELSFIRCSPNFLLTAEQKARLENQLEASTQDLPQPCWNFTKQYGAIELLECDLSVAKLPPEYLSGYTFIACDWPQEAKFAYPYGQAEKIEDFIAQSKIQGLAKSLKPDNPQLMALKEQKKLCQVLRKKHNDNREFRSSRGFHYSEMEISNLIEPSFLTRALLSLYQKMSHYGTSTARSFFAIIYSILLLIGIPAVITALFYRNAGISLEQAIRFKMHQFSGALLPEHVLSLLGLTPPDTIPIQFTVLAVLFYGVSSVLFLIFFLTLLRLFRWN